MAPTPSSSPETQVSAALQRPPQRYFAWHVKLFLLTLLRHLAETKNIADIAPAILKQLNQEQLAKLLAQQQQLSGGSDNIPGLVDDE
jgi:hypothetical protein